jgi:hypothetical protein
MSSPNEQAKTVVAGSRNSSYHGGRCDHLTRPSRLHYRLGASIGKPKRMDWPDAYGSLVRKYNKTWCSEVSLRVLSRTYILS